ncbi:MAG: deoxycytidylate deaminase, partial [Bacillota bacterium]
VGAVIVKERRILSTGYNGAPTGIPHCTEVGCLREQLKVPAGQRHELCRGLHAEQNGIVQAALYGVSIKDGVLYSTHQPCGLCAKMLVNAGIQKVYFQGAYPDTLALEILNAAGVDLERVP